VPTRPDLTNSFLEHRYLLSRQIGVGTVGTVYEALDVASREERVAIKVLHPEHAHDQASVERFKRVARAAARLRHPNIVDVRRFVTVPNTLPFLVMEYVEGETLHDLLKRARRITPHQAARIGVQVLAGLEAAHRGGVVHRDLRPDNIFLGPSAERVKIGDFGAAKILSESTGRPLTVTGMLIGTIAFMAPEQARAKNVDARSDLYALAATLYLAVSGRNPIEAPTPAALVEAVQHQEPRPFRELKLELDEGFEAIVRKGLQKDPAARFPNAKAMARALQTWLARTAPEPRTTASEDSDTKRYDTLEGVSAPNARGGTRPRVGLPHVGGEFGRYKVLALLGAGGVGEVYRAEDARRGGQNVALKVLRVARDTSESGLTLAAAIRILREARTAATIVHPNVITVFDVGEREGVPYLVTEYIRGETLRHYVGDPSIAIERRVGWAIDIAFALAAAHAKNVVHQDVKPENVMVRDEDGAIKVLDFGLARRVFESELFVHSETTERVPGTPAYMAPEQMHGREGSALTDQFAWGVLAYEILAGSLPWTQRGGFLHLVDQILTRVPEVPSRRRSDVPAEVERVVLKALAKRPEERFASMDDVAAALRQAWADAQAPTTSKATTGPTVEVTATPELTAQPGGAARRPRRRRAALAAVAAAALAVGAVVLAPHATTRTVKPAALAAPAEGAPPGESALSANAEALVAYRAGIDAIRNAAGSTARRSFDRAIKLDPSFAAAHLRKVLATPDVTDAERESVLKATQLRDALGEHDRALLHAIEPWVGVPADAREVERRLVALVATHADADTLYQLCRFRVLAGNYPAAIESCREARRLDPAFAGAMWLEAQSRMFLNDTAAGRALVRQCLQVAPSATSCMNDLFWLHSHEGACDAPLELAQRLVAADPTDSRWHEQLGAASYGMEKPLTSVRAAFEASSDAAPVRNVPLMRERGHFKLAVLTGNVTEAVRDLEAWEHAVAGTSDESAHREVLRARMLLNQELDRESDTLPYARAYRANQAAWTPGTDEDGTVDALVGLHRGGAMTRAEFTAARADWLTRERAAPRHGGQFGIDRGRVWINIYADAVRTPDDASEALRAMPEYLPLPPERFRDTEDDEAIGRTLLLAGSVSQSIPFLRRAASSCDAARYPFHQTWANLELAQALESSDVKGACAAYQIVFDRWATAVQSRSAHIAYVRRKALGCR